LMLGLHRHQEERDGEGCENDVSRTVAHPGRLRRMNDQRSDSQSTIQ
jgi:hypothetical protein